MAEADLGVELRAGQHVLGILQLVGPDEELLSDEELRTLEAFGNQAGAALERALLHEHLERRVQERTAELTAEVAARRRAEEALRAMAAIVESADDGMVRLGPDGRIETWNRGAARLYGYVGDEAVGNSIELVVAPDEVEGMRDMISRVAWGESIQGFETARLTRDGKRIEVSLTLVAGARRRRRGRRRGRDRARHHRPQGARARRCCRRRSSSRSAASRAASRTTSTTS